MVDSNNPKSSKIFSFLLKKECIVAIYVILAIIAGFKQYQHHSYNNYFIFKYVSFAHQTLTALVSFQFNIALTGLIIFIFIYLIKRKEVKSAVFMAIGTLIKLCGIVGLACSFFARTKIKLVIVGVVAFCILFIISLMGMERRINGNVELSNTPFLLGGLILFGLPYLRVNQFKHLAFRLMLPASTLIFILTSLSPTDIFPRAIKEFIRLYSLKALPCIIIWLTIIFQMLKEDFESYLTTDK